MVLLSAQGMDVAKIAQVTFTSPDRARDMIHNFNADGFASLHPKYKGGRPKTFTLPERREDQEDHQAPGRSSTACRSRPGAWSSWPTSWSPRGWSTTSATRACASCSARKASPFNA
ncbi:helix-turn-helix domain-containing protein [Streptomyces griseoviridis]